MTLRDIWILTGTYIAFIIAVMMATTLLGQFLLH